MAAAGRHGDVAPSSAEPGSDTTMCIQRSMTTPGLRIARSTEMRRATPPPVACLAAEFFASVGIEQISEVMTDNHWSYTRSDSVARLLADLGARHITIRPHCPWQNGKVERFNRTLQTEWAYRRIYTTNTERSLALTDWLDHYNYDRKHSSIGGPPYQPVSPT